MGIDWTGLVAAKLAAPSPIPTVVAKDFLGIMPGGYTAPCKLLCDDVNIWIAKRSTQDKSAVSDHIVGHLGRMLGAPIPPQANVMIEDDLLQREPQMAHMPPGLSHGSQYVPDLGVKSGPAFHSEENLPRYGVLEVLYCWMHPGDEQLIHENDVPRLAWSVDHGHFFPPPGPVWNAASLAAAPPPGRPAFFAGCPIRKEHYDLAIGRLAQVTVEGIAEAVALPPEGWDIVFDDRVALASYLHRRIPLVIQLYSV